MATKVSKARATSSGSYIQQSFQELRKVTWPTKQQAVRLTLLVLGFCLVATIILGVLDFSLNQGYRALLLARPQQPNFEIGDITAVPATGEDAGSTNNPTATDSTTPADENSTTNDATPVDSSSVNTENNTTTPDTVNP